MPTYDHPAAGSAQVARDTLVELRNGGLIWSGGGRVYNLWMRVLARLLLLPMLGGCSLIYNESNIPFPDPDAAEPDAEIIVDADPSMMKITGVNPAEIKEGQGADESRKALIVVDGEHLVKANLMVMVTASAGAAKTPMLMVDTAGTDVDANGRRLAIPITLPVDERTGGAGLVAGDQIPLDITVIQTVPGGPTVTSVLRAALTIRGLNELKAPPVGGFPGGLSEYSRVDITAGVVTVMAGQTEPVRVHAVSSLKITPMIDISAVDRTGGPAGGTGGMGGAGAIVGGAVGMMGTGPAKGLPSGGTGGFTGTEQVPSLEDPNRSSGGAGGNGGALGDNGGDGGGGGGSIDLVAGGDLTVGTILANGAAGKPGGTNPGGGGSGGVIVLRAGHDLTAATLNVTGVPTAGRARFDAGRTATVTSAASAFRGPMFVTPPLITADPKPMITVVGTASKPFRYYFSNGSGSDDEGPFQEMMSGTGQKSFILEKSLFPGLNKLCLLPDGAEAISNTRNCIDIALLYKPPT